MPYKSNVDNVIQTYRQNSARTIAECGEVLKKNITQEIITQDLRKSDEMLRSTYFKQDNHEKGIIYNSAKHAPFIDQGTWRISPRMFFRIGIFNSIRQMIEIYARNMKV